MTEAFVDTSFVIALIDKSDQYHSQALQLAARFDKHSLVTTDAVLLEIGNALARNFKAQPASRIDITSSSKNDLRRRASRRD